MSAVLMGSHSRTYLHKYMQHSLEEENRLDDIKALITTSVGFLAVMEHTGLVVPPLEVNQ